MIRNFFRNPNFSVDSMIEKERYDQRALEDIQKQVTSGKRESGIDGLPLHHHRPFLEFYNLIESNIKESDVVLEIGAGDGRHTFEICKTGAKVYVNDISELQLCLAKERLGERIELIPSDMTNLPIPDSSVDFVVCCGSLSYVDSQQILKEISRVLIPHGRVILLDTLNVNPIYRINRFIHYLAGRRTKMTLLNMPGRTFLKRFTTEFEVINFKTFGCFLWLYYPLNFVIGSNLSRRFCDFLDSLFSKSLFGFKFLLVGKLKQ